jgi:4-hydroxy-tetrahydrodipicolinate synthase
LRDPHVTGVVPAVLTPFHDDYRIDFATLARLTDRIASVDGVSAIFCTGHAGEVAALAPRERADVVRAVVEAVGGRMPVIAGVYTDSVSEAIEYAREAKKAGAAMATLFPPPIFADGGSDGSEMPFQYFKAVAQGAGMPLIVFQFDGYSHLAYTTDTLVRLASLPQVVAVKEGSADIGAYERNVRALAAVDPPLPVLTSNNSWLMASLAVGGDGILSGSSNVVAPLHVELWRAMQKRDLDKARAISDRLYPLVRVFYRPPFINMHIRMKEALVMMGVLPRATARPPLLPIDDAERAEIRAALKSAKLI